jgi:MoxR-like ATPase
MSNSVLELTEKIKAASAWVAPLRSTIGQVIIGQQYLIDRLILGLISNGHVLLEGVPGLAKTLSVRTLACAISANFKRIQFTPDLLPADIIGTLIYNPKEHTFETKKGPVFANLVLADEINRAPAKVQSALLEAMQERQVTIGDETHMLPKPFLVLATENPIDQEGTYTLPEAQVDRFMLKLSVGYPSKSEERSILDRMATTSAMEDVKPVITLEDILNARKVVNEVYVDDKIKDYIVDIVFATRYPKDYKLESDSLIQFGASPRATISLTLASKGWAFLQGRGYVTPQDVKTIAMDVLRHRVIVSYEAEAEGKTSEDIVQEILDTLPVP